MKLTKKELSLILTLIPTALSSIATNRHKTESTLEGPSKSKEERKILKKYLKQQERLHRKAFKLQYKLISNGHCFYDF